MIKLLTIIIPVMIIVNIGNLRVASAKDMKIGVDIGVALPNRFFYDVVNKGYGLDIVYSYYLNPQLIVTGQIGYWNFNTKMDGLSISNIQIKSGIQYRFNRDQIQPYISIEPLLFINSISYNNFGYSESGSKTEYGFLPCFGIAMSIQDDIEIRAALKYTIIFNSGLNTTFLGIMGGVHFKI